MEDVALNMRAPYFYPTSNQKNPTRGGNSPAVSQLRRFVDRGPDDGRRFADEYQRSQVHSAIIVESDPKGVMPCWGNRKVITKRSGPFWGKELNSPAS